MNDLNLIVEIKSVWAQAVDIWLSGGWAMIAIAILALLMFALGLNIQFRLAGKGFASIKEKKWRHWIDHPEEREGHIGDLLDFVTGNRTIKDTSVSFEEVRATEIAPFARDLNVMKKCVSAAPLLGLLGTVTGMLTTFAALATGAGGDKTMNLVAEGISEALITTETGLVIAIPGLFLQYQLSQKLDRYKVFLAHLETVCTQKLYRELHKEVVEPETLQEKF